MREYNLKYCFFLNYRECEIQQHRDKHWTCDNIKLCKLFAVRKKVTQKTQHYADTFKTILAFNRNAIYGSSKWSKFDSNNVNSYKMWI